MVSSGMLRRVALVRTDVSEEPSASFIRVTRICELGATQAATSNRHTLRRHFLQILQALHLFIGERLKKLYFFGRNKSGLKKPSGHA
jgi:hypothetical protein